MNKISKDQQILQELSDIHDGGCEDVEKEIEYVSSLNAMEIKNDSLTVLDKCTRLEIVDKKGRVLIRHFSPGDLSISVQDEKSTLKLFFKNLHWHDRSQYDREKS